jgi:hypothetical protein
VNRDGCWEPGFERVSNAWLPAPARNDVLALALLACLWLLLAVIGCGARAHAHIDDGRELQLPVEIASGKALSGIWPTPTVRRRRT